MNLNKIIAILTILGVVLIGTATSATATDSVDEDSLFFNGSNSLTVPDNPLLRCNNELNITFRAKPEGSTFGLGTVLGKGSYAVRTNESGLYASIQNSTGATFSTPPISGVPLSGWHQYAVVYDGAYLGLYMDDTLVTGTNATGSKCDTKELILGSGWNGYLDAIRINEYLISK